MSWRSRKSLSTSPSSARSRRTPPSTPPSWRNSRSRAEEDAAYGAEALMKERRELKGRIFTVRPSSFATLMNRNLDELIIELSRAFEMVDGSFQ